MDQVINGCFGQVIVEVGACRECAAMDDETFEYLAVTLLKGVKERTGRGLGEDDIYFMTAVSYHMSGHSKKKLEDADDL